jgi:acyl carrier protein
MADAALLLRVKQMLVRQLNLKKKPEDLSDEAALFGGELDLDSIDVLEIVVGIEKDFGVRISDRAVGEKVIRTPRTIADFVANADLVGGAPGIASAAGGPA